MKKLFSVFLSSLLIFCNLSIINVSFADNIYGDFKYKISNSTITITEYIGENNQVIVPSKINDKEVTGIGEFAFDNCKNITSIKLPNTINKIEKFAFSDCAYLANINIPNNVATIGNFAFSNCYRLTNITIPEKLNIINKGVFENCKSLTTIAIPENIKDIKDMAFWGCEKLKSVTLSEGITTIGDDVFYGCSNLKDITIPKSVTDIGFDVFDSYNLVIRGYKDSYAETYAKEHYIDFIDILNPNLKKVINIKQSYRTTSAIKLTWNKVSEADGYYVYRASSKNGTYKKIATLKGYDKNYYTNSKLTSGKVYYYKIKAYKKIDSNYYYGNYSDIYTASTKCLKPSITATSPKTKTAKINWKKVTGASGYQVYRATSKNGKYSLKKTITSSSTLNYTNTGLTKGKTYYYKVRAYKLVNGIKIYSDYSSIKYIKAK